MSRYDLEDIIKEVKRNDGSTPVYNDAIEALARAGVIFFGSFADSKIERVGESGGIFSKPVHYRYMQKALGYSYGGPKEHRNKLEEVRKLIPVDQVKLYDGSIKEAHPVLWTFYTRSSWLEQAGFDPDRFAKTFKDKIALTYFGRGWFNDVGFKFDYSLIGSSRDEQILFKRKRGFGHVEEPYFTSRGLIGLQDDRTGKMVQLYIHSDAIAYDIPPYREILTKKFDTPKDLYDYLVSNKPVASI